VGGLGGCGGCGMHAVAPDSRIAGRAVAIGVASPGVAPAHRAVICAPTRRKTSVWKAKEMRRHPRVAISVTDMANPYHMAAIQGRMVEVRPDEDCHYMDPISFKYTNRPFPRRGPDCLCFVIAVENAARPTLAFVQDPSLDGALYPGRT
jgi:hypothetical protein